MRTSFNSAAAHTVMKNVTAASVALGMGSISSEPVGAATVLQTETVNSYVLRTPTSPFNVGGVDGYVSDKFSFDLASPKGRLTFMRPVGQKRDLPYPFDPDEASKTVPNTITLSSEGYISAAPQVLMKPINISVNGPGLTPLVTDTNEFKFGLNKRTAVISVIGRPRHKSAVGRGNMSHELLLYPNKDSLHTYYRCISVSTNYLYCVKGKAAPPHPGAFESNMIIKAKNDKQQYSQDAEQVEPLSSPANTIDTFPAQPDTDQTATSGQADQTDVTVRSSPTGLAITGNSCNPHDPNKPRGLSKNLCPASKPFSAGGIHPPVPEGDAWVVLLMTLYTAVAGGVLRQQRRHGLVSLSHN